MTDFLKDIVTGPRITIVTGHFGSGKTEFSVSLAFALAALRNKAVNTTGSTGAAFSSEFSDAEKKLAGAERKLAGAETIQAAPSVLEGSLALCDLDIENPYFRSRELTESLEKEGVMVYSDPYHGRNGSELQTLDPAILAPVENPDCRVILDTGGNSQGAMILNQFRKHFESDYRMLYIVNKNRPGNDTPEKVLADIREIENATGLTMTGLISNSHFIRETTVQDVRDGFSFAKTVGEISHLPVLCACCSRELSYNIKADGEMTIFPIGMYMRQTYLDKPV